MRDVFHWHWRRTNLVIPKLGYSEVCAGAVMTLHAIRWGIDTTSKYLRGMLSKYILFIISRRIFQQFTDKVMWWNWEEDGGMNGSGLHTFRRGDCSESFQFLISPRPSALSVEVILLFSSLLFQCFLLSFSNFIFRLIDWPLFLLVTVMISRWMCFKDFPLTGQDVPST